MQIPAWLVFFVLLMNLLIWGVGVLVCGSYGLKYAHATAGAAINATLARMGWYNAMLHFCLRRKEFNSLVVYDDRTNSVKLRPVKGERSIASMPVQDAKKAYPRLTLPVFEDGGVTTVVDGVEFVASPPQVETSK